MMTYFKVSLSTRNWDSAYFFVCCLPSLWHAFFLSHLTAFHQGGDGINFIQNHLKLSQSPARIRSFSAGHQTGRWHQGEGITNRLAIH